MLVYSVQVKILKRIFATVYSCLGFLLLVLLPPQSLAAVDDHKNFPIRLTISDFGIYRVEKTDRSEFVANSTAGYTSVVSGQLLETTTKIPLEKYLAFGFEFYISDTSTDQQWVPVVMQYMHPETEDYLGKRSRGFSQQAAARLREDGRYHNSALYVFSEANEMLPGEWLIRVIYRGEIMVSKQFTVLEK